MVAKIWEIQHFSEALHVTSLVPTGFKICSWQENEFLVKSPVDECVFFFIFTQKFKISHRFRDKSVFALYTEIQDGHPKWRKSDFWEKSPAGSAYTMWVKNLVKIPLSRTVSKINELLRFTQKFKMVAKKCMKTIFVKCCQYTQQIPCGSKLIEIAVSHTVSKINAFLRFTQKFRFFLPKMAKKQFLGKVAKNLVEIALSCTVSKINALMHFAQKFKMAAKSGGKVIFVKSRQ